MEAHLLNNIETLRHQMIQEAAVQGHFLHRKVITLSQKLDTYIVDYQMLKQQTANKIKIKSND